MHTKSDRFSHLLRELAVPRILEYVREHDATSAFGVVSVPDIRVSRDFSYADIYITAERDPDGLPAFLAPIAPDIRTALASTVSVFRIPVIRFRVRKDDGTGDRVYAMINELTKQYSLGDAQ